MLLSLTLAAFVAALFIRIAIEDRRNRRRIDEMHEDFCRDVRAVMNETGDEVERGVFADRRAA